MTPFRDNQYGGRTNRAFHQWVNPHRYNKQQEDKNGEEKGLFE